MCGAFTPDIAQTHACGSSPRAIDERHLRKDMAFSIPVILRHTRG